MALLRILTFLLCLRHSVDGKQAISSVRRLRKPSNPPVMEWYSFMNNSYQQIDLVGPANRWFAFGIGNSTMDNTYAFVISEDGELTEHILGDHNAGMMLPTSETELNYSSTVSGNYRTVTIYRNREGYSNLFYTFPDSKTTDVPLIAAWGSVGDEFGYYHGSDQWMSDTVDFALYNETTNDPTNAPTNAPTYSPTDSPTNAPTDSPTLAPSLAPTFSPTVSFENRYDAWGYSVFGNGYEEDQLDRIEIVLGLEYDSETIFINITGPTGQWFAVGFSDAVSLTAQYGMENAYAIIVDWKRGTKDDIDDDDIREYMLKNHKIGDEETKVVEVKTQYPQIQFRRNVLMERSRNHDDSQFTFDKCPREYNLVWSRGTYSPADPKYFGNDTHNIYNRGLATVKMEFKEGDEYAAMREACSDTVSVCKGMLMQIILSVFVFFCVIQ